MTDMTQIPPPSMPTPETQQAPVGPNVIETNKEARTWAMITHLSALSGFIGIPLGWILGPLVIWLVKKDTLPFVDRQGKEAMNWQLTMLIAAIVCIPLMFICVGVIVMAVLGVVDFVFPIIAALKANEGVEYKYPWRIRFFK
jgi:uncharacterized Tic20 family protein